MQIVTPAGHWPWDGFAHLPVDAQEQEQEREQEGERQWERLQCLRSKVTSHKPRRTTIKVTRQQNLPVVRQPAGRSACITCKERHHGEKCTLNAALKWPRLRQITQAMGAQYGSAGRNITGCHLKVCLQSEA